MPKKKLTESLKKKIKSDYANLKLKDYEGEALAYLKQVRGGAKGRKAQKESKGKVEEFTIPKDSELYRVIKGAADYNKMSVSKFVKTHKKAVMDFAREGDFVVQRETEYLIEDISKLKTGKSVFINDGNGYIKVSRNKAILLVQQFTQHVLSNSDIFLIIYRVHYKLNGDLTFYLPNADDYEQSEEPEDIEAVFDNFYPEINYLKSGKKTETPEKPKIIKPYSKERKRKNKPVYGAKRKGQHKTTKRK